MNRYPDTERGYTIQELLVVLLVGSLVLGYSLGLFLSIQRILGKVQRTMALHDAVNGTIQAMALDVQRAVSAASPVDSLLLLELPERADVRYAGSGGCITRNGEWVVSDSAILMLLSVQVVDPGSWTEGAPPQVRIVISGRRRELVYEAHARVAPTQGGRDMFGVASGTRRSP
jgi:hypothetical protein